MVDNLNLTTLISQIPEAQKIHHTQLAHPEAQQALAQEMVLRWIRKGTSNLDRMNFWENGESIVKNRNSTQIRDT